MKSAGCRPIRTIAAWSPSPSLTSLGRVQVHSRSRTTGRSAERRLAASDNQALAYSFGLREVGQDRKTGQVIWAPHIIWHPQHVDVTAAEAMAAAIEAKAPAARDSAKKFLLDLLAAGPITKREIEEAAEANCIASRTLERAKAELGIIAKKDGPNGSWTWRLPPTNRYWSD